jgi:hypothetical protein
VIEAMKRATSFSVTIAPRGRSAISDTIPHADFKANLEDAIASARASWQHILDVEPNAVLFLQDEPFDFGQDPDLHRLREHIARLPAL